MHLKFLNTELNEPWLALKQPQVRQLAFCIGSPYNILQSIPADLNLHFSFSFTTIRFGKITSKPTGLAYNI